MHFCGLAKARNLFVVHDHYSRLCRIAGGLSYQQNLARLCTAVRPGHVLTIGGAAVAAGSILHKVS